MDLAKVPSTQWFRRKGGGKSGGALHPKAANSRPIVNHGFFHPKFVQRKEIWSSFGMGGYACIHSRVDTRDASLWPWGITLGSKTLFSSFLFTTELACLTPEIPCEDAMLDTSPSKNQGNIRHFGPGTCMSPSPGDRQYSFPKTLA